MKKINIKYTIGLMTVLFLHSELIAQTDSIIKLVPEIKKEIAMLSPSMELVSVQKSDKTIDLKASIKTKAKGVFTKLPLLKITFIKVDGTTEKVMGFAITDRNGKAILNTKSDSLITDKEGKLNFKAVFAGNKGMEPIDASLSIKRALLIITPVKEDSTNSIHAKLLNLISGAETPVPSVAVGLYVKRLLNPLKIGEGTTDSNGSVVIGIPKNLPGDAKENITLIARIDENEIYGNLEASILEPWGTVVSDANTKAPRALWSTRPPIWMLDTFIVLMTIVWGHYIVIIYELFRLRKEEPTQKIIS